MFCQDVQNNKLKQYVIIKRRMPGRCFNVYNGGKK